MVSINLTKFVLLLFLLSPDLFLSAYNDVLSAPACRIPSTEFYRGILLAGSHDEFLFKWFRTLKGYKLSNDSIINSNSSDTFTVLSSSTFRETHHTTKQRRAASVPWLFKSNGWHKLRWNRIWRRILRS